MTASDGTKITNDYDNVLPALITRYQLSENSVIRAAWTNGISRPDFDDLRPLFDDEFDYDDTDPLLPVASLAVSGGNPDIKPFEATSFDLLPEG